MYFLPLIFLGSWMSCLAQEASEPAFVQEVTQSEESAHEQITHDDLDYDDETLAPEEALAMQTAVLNQIDGLLKCFQHIAQLIQAGVIQQKNMAPLYAWTKETSFILQEHYKKAQQQQVTPHLIKQELLLNQALLDHLIFITKHKLAVITIIDPEAIVHRSSIIEPTTENLEKLFAENTKKVQELHELSDNLGTTAVNRFFRRVDRILRFPGVTPLLKISAAGIVGYCAWKGFSTYFHEAPHDVSEELRKHFATQYLPNATGSALGQIFSGGINYFYGVGAGIVVSNYSYARQVLSNTYDKLKGENKKISPSARHIVEDITFDDPRLIGLKDQIQLLYRNIIHPMLNPELFLQHGMELERACALIGPSRNGKTLLARALCGTINQLFRAAGRSDRIGFREIHHYELASSNLKSIIKWAQENGPMVLFIDEFHLRRAQTTGSSELFEYLTELNALYETNDPHKMVFLIIATNRPDLIDPALFQHKRFGLVIRFEKPNHMQRTEFFTERSKYQAVSLSEEELHTLVAQTNNCSYGDLDQIFQEAVILAKFNNESLSSKHLQQVINRLIHKITSKFAMNDKEQKTAAAHYAGHVICNTERIELVTINSIERKIKEKNDYALIGRGGVRQNPNDDTIYHARYGKLVTYNEQEALKLQTTQETITHTKRLLAGAVAEELLLGSRSLTFHAKDRQKAYTLLMQIELKGMQESQLSKKQLEVLKDTVNAQLMKLEQDVHKELKQAYAKLEKVYQALLEKRLLLHHDLEELLA